MKEPGDILQSTEGLLEEFLHFESLGLRNEAKRAVLVLVDTVASIEEKEAWTNANLKRLPLNRSNRIRHEIYKHIVFPSLKAALHRGEAEAYYLFGKYAGNLYSDRSLFKQVGERGAMEFFCEAYNANPNSSLYESAYLGSLLQVLEYTFHEWPTGILIDHADWRNELDDLREQLSLAMSLDRNGEYVDLLAEWSQITEDYGKRLAARGTGQ